MASLGDIKDLVATGIQVANFINDLRHAQDGFNALRAEAQCLQVCINSLCSASCQDTLYHYMSVEQRGDLRTIILNTKLNMKDLNDFLETCKALVEKESKKTAKQQGLMTSWKGFVKEAWAALKFTWTNPQPFRDKLALPTASINIFLTSMTHVGLANVGSLLALNGTLPTSMPIGNGNATGTKAQLPMWEVIGSKISFKRGSYIGNARLTLDLEEEILRYANYILTGGKPFTPTQEKSKIGRSKSVSRDSGLSIMRKKRTVNPGYETRLDYGYDDHTDIPHRARLDVPETPSTPHIIDAVPDFEHSDHQDYRPAYAEHARPDNERKDTFPGGLHGKKFSESSRHEVIDEALAEIEQDQHEARTVLAAKTSTMRQERRSYRRQERMSRIHRPEEHEAESSASDSDVDEEEAIMAVLESDYGVIVEPLCEPRQCVDHGTVAPAIPASIIPSKDNVEMPRHTAPPQRSRSSQLKTETQEKFVRARRNPSYTPRYTPYERRSGKPYEDRGMYGKEFEIYGKDVRGERPMRFEADSRYDLRDEYESIGTSHEEHEGIYYEEYRPDEQETYGKAGQQDIVRKRNPKHLIIETLDDNEIRKKPARKSRTKQRETTTEYEQYQPQEYRGLNIENPYLDLRKQSKSVRRQRSPER